MKIRDFHITGQYPALSVETEIEDSSQAGSGQDGSRATVRVNLGPWNYVSLLNEKELKSLVHLVYERQRRQEPTDAMNSLHGASLDDAANSELP